MTVFTAIYLIITTLSLVIMIYYLNITTFSLLRLFISILRPSRYYDSLSRYYYLLVITTFYLVITIYHFDRNNEFLSRDYHL